MEFSVSTVIFISSILARFLVGFVLLVAGLAKLKMPSNSFSQAIIEYKLIPRPIAILLAKVLPWAEVLVGGLLIFGFWSKIATIGGIVLLFIFSSAVTVNLLRGKNNDCGCFKSVKPIQWNLVSRNLVLIGLLIFVYVSN